MGEEYSAEEILENAEAAMFPDNFYAVIELITQKTNKEDKTMTIASYYKKNVGSFMEIQAPTRSKGIRFLQIDNNLWMYNPRSNSRKAMRLSLRDSFQGTALSNNDMSDPNYTDDYNVSIIKKTIFNHPDLGDLECYLLEGIAKLKSTTYKKVHFYVSVEKLLPINIEYYTKSDYLFKTMLFSDFKKSAGRERPTKYIMTSLEEKGTVSLVYIKELEIRNDLSDSLFSKTALVKE